MYDSQTNVSKLTTPTKQPSFVGTIVNALFGFMSVRKNSSQNLNASSNDMDVQNVSSIDGFTSHDEISMIEEMQIQDVIPTTTRLVNQYNLLPPKPQTPSHRTVPLFDLSRSAIIDELQTDLQVGIERV